MMKIRTKLLLSLVAALAGLGIVGGVALFTWSQQDSLTTTVLNDLLPRQEALLAARQGLSDLRQNEVLYLATTDEAARGEIRRQMEGQLANIQERLAAYERLLNGPEDRAQSQELRQQWLSYRVWHGRWVALASPGEARSQLLDDSAEFQLLGRRMEEIARQEEARARAVVSQAWDYSQARWWLLGALLGVGLVSTGMGYLWGRSLTRRLAVLTEAMRRLAQGELSPSVPVQGKDELADLARALNDLAQALQHRRGEVSQLHAAQREASEVSAALLRVAQAIQSPAGLDEILGVIVQTSSELIGCQRGRLYLWDEERNQFIPRQAWGLDESLAQAFWAQALSPGDMPRLAHRLRQRELVVVEDASRDELLPPEHKKLFALAATIGVPLVGRGGVMGVLFLDYASAPAHLGPRERALITGIANQAAAAVENARFYQELTSKEEEQRQLLEKVITAQEEERKRIARELHDETGQALTALLMGLAAVEEGLPAGHQELRRILESTRTLAAQSMDDLHKLMWDLRPTLLDDLGLVPALRWYARHVLEPLGVRVTVEDRGLRERLAPAMETALFRIVQEAITNVAKHARARSALIVLERHDGRLMAVVEDDGQGFAPQEKRGTKDRGWGILGMEERAHLLGGTLDIKSSLGQGTRLSVQVPIATEAQL